MKSQHLKMTVEEFRQLPPRLGWKHEYYDGEAHLSPRCQVVSCSVAVAPRPFSSPYRLLPIAAEDAEPLTAAYLAAFGDTVEYCDWGPEDTESSARRSISGYYAGSRGTPLPASRKAMPSAIDDPRILGVALVVEHEPGEALLDLLLVVPAAQRRGVATALVSEVLTQLLAAGVKTLHSRYLLANEASRAWHHGFGFVDEPEASHRVGSSAGA